MERDGCRAMPETAGLTRMSGRGGLEAERRREVLSADCELGIKRGGGVCLGLISVFLGS